MNKLLPFTLLLLLALCSLAACGGGGGGGGGGVSPPVMVQAPHAFSDVANYLPTNSAYNFYRDGDTIVMSTTKLPPPDNITLVNRSDFTLDDDGYWKVEKNKPDDDSAKLLTIYLGGKKAGLEYSDFGLWMNYAGASKPTSPATTASPYYNPDQVAPLPAGNELTFTGNAIAILNTPTRSGEILKGDAIFQVSNGSYSLTLDFEDFYIFKFDMTNATDNTPGKFKTTGVPTMSKGNSSSAVPTNGYFQPVQSYAYAHFVGASGGPASEGVGYYMLYYYSQTPSDRFNLHGSYGVKIEP